MIESSRKFVTLMLRRPHAYAFANDHKGATIPGIAFFDADGKLVGNFDMAGSPEAKALLAEMAKLLK